MSENQTSESKASFGTQTKWLASILFSPRKTFNKIAQQTRGIWVLPLILMSISAIAYASVSASAGAPFSSANMQEMDFENFGKDAPYSDEEWDDSGSNLLQPAAPSTPSGLLNGVSGVLRVWVSWGILSAVLYLSLTLSGGRTESFHLMNIIAWAGIPLALRDLVRIVGVSLAHRAILNPGLSGLLTVNETSVTLFLVAFLGLVDIYLFWSMGLLVLGGKTVSGVSAGKALKAVLIPVLFLLALYALAGAGAQTLGQQLKEGASFMEDF